MCVHVHRKVNIVDTMFKMLEKYSTDLEEIVRVRTIALEEERKKTENLLSQMLPALVVHSSSNSETKTDCVLYYNYCGIIIIICVWYYNYYYIVCNFLCSQLHMGVTRNLSWREHWSVSVFTALHRHT